VPRENRTRAPCSGTKCDPNSWLKLNYCFNSAMKTRFNRANKIEHTSVVEGLGTRVCGGHLHLAKLVLMKGNGFQEILALMSNKLLISNDGLLECWVFLQLSKFLKVKIKTDENLFFNRIVYSQLCHSVVI